MSSQKQSYPRVGVGVVLFCVQSGEILVGTRKGSIGSGQWALPGGALEWKETSSSCAKRELHEETGIDLNEVWHEELHDSLDEGENDDDKCCFHTCESIIDDSNHWITLFRFFCVNEKDVKGKEKTMEPNKCEGWKWRRPEEIQEPMFTPLRKLLQSGKLLRITTMGANNFD